MNINILNILEVRKPNESINWLPLMENNLIIPKIYKLFFETYNVITYSNVKIFEYYSRESDAISNFGIYNIDFENLKVIDSFFDVNLIKDVLDYISNSNDNTIKTSTNGFIPIGLTPSNKYLLVGINESNLDNIYLQTEDTNLYLSSNIFEFCRNIYLIPQPSRWLPDLSKLYKNWGEDFWRVRE